MHSSSLSDHAVFVLVEPQFGGNVGAAARALKNLGFARMRLVRPACDPRGEEARRMAVDAEDVLERAEVHDDLDRALAGASTVAGLTRRAGKHRHPHYRLDTVADELAALGEQAGIALLFGREDHGASDADLDRCTHLVRLPASDEYPSFNLAAAVLLTAYELRRVRLPAEPDPVGPPADHGSREAMYEHLREALWKVGYLHEDSAVPMMRRLRRMLGKARLTDEEVRILRGVAHQVLWLAGKSLPP
jgi:TrmH family RNA methyltransferase